MMTNNNTKQELPNEIKDIVLLNYNFEVAYQIVDDTSGDFYDGGNTTINGNKYFTTEEECKTFFETVEEDPSNELADDFDIYLRASLLNVEKNNSTSKKISLIDLLKRDGYSYLSYLDTFLKSNPNYELVGDLKLVKKTNLETK
jgi:hypothetical protein